MWLCRTGICLLRGDQPGLDVEHLTQLRAVDALDDRLPDELLLQGRVRLGALLEVEVLPLVALPGLDLELRVLVEVDDLDLRLRLHHIRLAALQRLELRGACDEAEDEAIELRGRRGLEGRVPDQRQLRALLPALELERAAGDVDRVLPELVEVDARDLVRRHDARLPMSASHAAYARFGLK